MALAATGSGESTSAIDSSAALAGASIGASVVASPAASVAESPGASTPPSEFGCMIG
jgi:hypothetical protein